MATRHERERRDALFEEARAIFEASKAEFEALQKAVKKTMAEKLFGQRDELHASPEPREFSGSVFEAIRLLAETVQQVTKK